MLRHEGEGFADRVGAAEAEIAVHGALKLEELRRDIRLLKRFHRALRLVERVAIGREDGDRVNGAEIEPRRDVGHLDEDETRVLCRCLCGEREGEGSAAVVADEHHFLVERHAANGYLILCGDILDAVLAVADGPTEVHQVQVANALLKKAVPATGIFPTEHIPTKTEAARARYEPTT